VNAMLNMDMIGWSVDANLGVIIGTTTASVSNPQANIDLVNLIADAGLTYATSLNPSLITKNFTSCCSDHMPYLVQGNRPGAMSIHRGSAAAYPHYHQSSDTPVNLGTHAQAIGAAIVRMNVGALAQLAGANDRIFATGHDSP
jgi:Zn-dependent M28 family amino/carboxypeptidase